jgi:ADP-dependent NAD(P)H-hydrate dehydratase / NAD(P)H-hydrate epimerase
MADFVSETASAPEPAFEALYTAAEMRAAEERYPGYPETVPELMDRAGSAVADVILARYDDARRITVVCGPGNNGGDGRVAARLLEQAGRDVRIVESKPEEEEKELGDPELIVDALFGTGFETAPRSAASALIERMNAAGVPIVSVDVPSGVNASTGEVPGTAVSASLTATFHGHKVGLHVAPGRFRAGEIVVTDIGLEPHETEHRLVDRTLLRRVPRKRDGDNKYTAGAVLVVGGSRGLTGAACLAAEAAFRADAGYVAVAVPRSALPVIEQRLLEAVKRPCAEDDAGRLALDALDDIFAAVERMDAVALGPGLGRSEETKALVRRLLAELRVPVVVDADALWELEPGDWPAPRVLTPHEGELARLLGEESSWVAAHRLDAARRAAARFRCVVLLKGADTLVAGPQGKTLVRSLNAPSLATAGTGDVLTGILAAFLAKGMEARLAAAAASVAQAVAALSAPLRSGLVASDVVQNLPRALDAR